MATLYERAKLLEEASLNPSMQRALVNECRNDIIFWFEWFCYTFNPRVTPAHLPFNPYPFQKETIKVIQSCVQRGEPLIIEKSRDMGLSWLVLLVFQWFWIFEDGADFLCGSRKQDDVDKKGDRSALFEKFRYNLRMQPEWMCPKLTYQNDNYLKITHPITGNILKGESATADFGRSQRFKAVLMDEVARHPYGDYAYASVSQSSNCIILLFTPFGQANIAYRMRQHPEVEWVDIGGGEDGRIPSTGKSG